MFIVGGSLQLDDSSRQVRSIHSCDGPMCTSNRRHGQSATMERLMSHSRERSTGSHGRRRNDGIQRGLSRSLGRNTETSKHYIRFIKWGFDQNTMLDWYSIRNTKRTSTNTPFYHRTELALLAIYEFRYWTFITDPRDKQTIVKYWKKTYN